MSIPSSQARARFTQAAIDVYKERPQVMQFLSSFFPAKEYATRYLSLEVQRGTEYVAADVIRGTQGNRNTFSKSTEKVFDPPYYREWFDITSLDLYDRLMGSTTIDAGIMSQLLNNAADKYGMIQAKIERAYELQRAQALTTGIITLQNGDNIDFQRDALSLVANGAGNTWATGTVDPRENIQTGCNFLRTKGKVQGGVFNIIMGENAYSDFVNNTIIQNTADIMRMDFINLNAPQRNSTGASYMGRIACGPYLVDIWTYPEYYETSNNVMTPYIDPKKYVLLPQTPRFEMSFAAVPQLLDEENPNVVTGAFVFQDYRDEENEVHKYYVKSAGCAMLKAVDHVYTEQVVAS